MHCAVSSITPVLYAPCYLPQELERGLEIVKRNHTQEEKGMLRRNKALAHEVAELRDYTQKMHKQLKVCRSLFTQP